jgi:hypothetical protein
VCEKANAGKTMTYQERTQKPHEPLIVQTDNEISASKKQKMDEGNEQLAWTGIESFLGQNWLQTSYVFG